MVGSPEKEADTTLTLGGGRHGRGQAGVGQWELVHNLQAAAGRSNISSLERKVW